MSARRFKSRSYDLPQPAVWPEPRLGPLYVPSLDDAPHDLTWLYYLFVAVLSCALGFAAACLVLLSPAHGAENPFVMPADKVLTFSISPPQNCIAVSVGGDGAVNIDWTCVERMDKEWPPNPPGLSKTVSRALICARDSARCGPR